MWNVNKWRFMYKYINKILILLMGWLIMLKNNNELKLRL